MEHGDSMTDVFEGVEFTWTSVEGRSHQENGGGYGSSGTEDSLELSFDAEHTDMALGSYVSFITATGAQDIPQRGGALAGHQPPPPGTFDTLAMDPVLKQSVITDLDRFLKRRDYYRRIGKAWKRGYLLYGPPGTGKSSMVYSNSALQRLLNGTPNKCILVIEDIDCCFSTASRKEKDDSDYGDYRSGQANSERSVTLSGLLNFIDGLWSTSGEERIIIFTTNYKERLDSALLRPGRMDMHIYMGYCCYEAFKTLARNYHLIDDHMLFPGDTAAAFRMWSEMRLRSEESTWRLRVLAEFLREKKQATREKRPRCLPHEDEVTGKEAEEGDM
ncbi:hypothetical protein HU200_013126 [Digitaria exilis]|uniref:ATPase AAA-type core domain-containing protein n=1 Tax=Digitaria exilis TaxID=1010633 RepID=A0A835FDL5_9POAL|nr:hypothetical protein HU200_013126 [Digitaria exilis]